MTEHSVRVRCYETLGVPNSQAVCTCGEQKTYYPREAKELGFVSDLAAADDWASQHEASA